MAINKAKWLLRINRATSAIESEGRMYDVKVTLLKGLKALAISVGAVAASAALAYLGDPAAVSKALEGSLSPVLVVALVPIITGAAHAGLNWLKNR